MAFTETTILSTREPSFGIRKLGQILAVPTGRIDKMSVYLEPVINDLVLAKNIEVRVEIFMVDSGRIPIGLPVVSDTTMLSEIKSRGFLNFRLESILPSVVAVIVSTTGATLDNHIAWRYVSTPTSGEELLISDNGGVSWTQDPNRKFAFVAYSTIDDVVDQNDQSAEVQAGIKMSLTDDTEAEFSISELTRTVVSGDTVVINFGNFFVTLVVDMSGSMTWNDNDGVRFDFLKDYIDNLEASLPVTSSVEYSLIKFRSRKIGSIDTLIQTEDAGAFIEGARIVRKVGSPPTGPSDGLIVFDDIATQYEDRGLTSGTLYYYGIFVRDSEDNFSEGRFDSAIPQSPPAPPISVASIRAVEVIDLVGDFDIGKRKVKLTWVHPEGLDYNKITLVRRDDRPPETATDGTVVHTDTGPSLDVSFTDFSVSSDAITALTYYYAIFTEDTVTGLKAFGVNARRVQITVSVVDRIWDKAEPGFDSPPPGFDDTPPLPPSGTIATPGPKEILLTWSPGDSDNKRYQIFYRPDRFSRQETVEDGFGLFDGQSIFDGTATSFTHRDLVNDQPHFYSIVSFDAVANQSTVVEIIGRPDEEAAAIGPDSVSNFSTEVINESTNLLTWNLEISRIRKVEAFFGDTIRLTGLLTFEDSDPRTTSSEFSFIEENRIIRIFGTEGQPILDADETVDAELAIIVDQAPAENATTINADVSVIPFTSIQNLMFSATIAVHPTIRITDKSTGNVITEVVGPTVTVVFNNPFNLSVLNDPPQNVTVRSIKETCNGESRPEIISDSIDGVFVKSGNPFLALLEAKFRGEALTEDIDLTIRILDANTQQVTSRIRLAQTGSDGVAIIRTINELDEVLDRTDDPTGNTLERTITRISLPPQDIPGEFVIEITGGVFGFTRTVLSDVRYVSSLNIDVKSKEFIPDGVNIAEQEAFVYFGDPTQEDKKVPVPDLTVIKWDLTKISGGGPPIRPFFSRDTVPGTGVRSFTREGISRNIFFGPGTDIEPPKTVTCTDGEMYLMTVTAEASGMEGTGWGIVELSPYESTDLKSIFLRLSEDQVDEFGNSVKVGNLANHSIFSDGEQESAWEVVARPEEDTESGSRSGIAYQSAIVEGGGLVPSLEDGTIVSIVINRFSSAGIPSDVLVRTDLTGLTGRPGSAKATVINGKAKFFLSGNFRTSGKIEDPPLNSEFGNPFFNSSDILWTPASRIFFISVHTVLEINGKPSIFGGGGGNLNTSVPPAFLSFQEPLAVIPG